MNDSDIMGIRAASRLLRQDPRTVYRMVADTDIPSLQHRTENDKVQFSRTAIEAFNRRRGELAAEADAERHAS